MSIHNILLCFSFYLHIACLKNAEILNYVILITIQGVPVIENHMKKITSILSLCLLGHSFCFAQSSTKHCEVNPRKISDGYITEKINLKQFAAPEVVISNTVYEPVSGTPPEIPVDAATEVALGMERKQAFAFINIPVFKKNEAGTVSQLVSFDLNIEEQNTTKPKPLAKTTGQGESVLASGTWYKISVATQGIYKVDYDFIKNKLNTDPALINPDNIRIFGNGGLMMSENNAVDTLDDLVENNIEVHDGGDHKMDPGDYILFYASGPMGWAPYEANKSFYHYKNLFEDKSYYFISFDKGTGKRIPLQKDTTVSGAIPVNTCDQYAVHEEDLVNIGRFGKTWWGEDFGVDAARPSSRTFTLHTGTSDTCLFRLSIGSKSNSTAAFKVTVNNVYAGTFTLSGLFSDQVVSSSNISVRMPTPGGTATVQLDYVSNDNTAVGYLGFIEVTARSPLSLYNGSFNFRDWNSVGTGNWANFRIGGSNGNTAVWDVTDPLHPVKIAGSLSGNSFSFTNDASTLHEYVAFDASNFLSPEFVSSVAPQNLHGLGPVDLIVVTHPDFIEAANKIADFHQQHDGMRTVVATTDQIYNEFGSGSQDIAAIRDFARMLYRNAGTNTADMPSYLLLMGDASFDYKDRIPNNSNFVPTYETSESDDDISGYCSDDFFSFLDDHENIEGIQGNGYAVVNTMDLSVGRLPVNTAEAANRLVDKIINYASPASLGPWRLSTTIMADDGDQNVHFDDGEIMAATVNTHSNLYSETKVYISATPLVSTPGGVRAPDCNKAINDQVYKGTFLMNYNGHGSITTLAHERILTQDDFNGWKNENKLPVVVTATCSFSKYDDPSYVSAGEQLIVKPDGGAIAMLTTTQLVYQYLNRQMNVDFLDAFFQKYDGKWPTFGDAFRMGKNATYVRSNQYYSTLGNFRKFALLGDPALTPAFPRYNVVTEAVIDGYTQLPTDTLKALGKYQISGSVQDENGQLLSDFNGRVYVTIYDKARLVQTLTGPTRNFQVQNNIIYKGKASVTNGLFSFAFIAPKDINYTLGTGKISYYAENGLTDAAGSDTLVKIGGSSDIVAADETAPLVKPFMNDSLFIDGGITGSNSILFVQLYDESGINVSGNSVGHDLTGVLDGNVASPYILNDYYETSPNEYQHGFVNFPVSGLSDGEHTLTVKAWDMYNNSGEGTVRFVVVRGEVVAINNLMNYPNPFRDKTHFVFEHNHPGEDMKVEINIYSNSGYLVRTIRDEFTPNGSRSNEIVWDGTDDNGAQLRSGLYVYKLSLITSQGIRETAYQKLVIIR